MLETLSFIVGFGFSILVYVLSIRTGPFTAYRKAGYFILSMIGITGMVWLSGVLVAHFLRRLGLP
jgi:hypothetical protein